MAGGTTPWLDLASVSLEDTGVLADKNLEIDSSCIIPLIVKLCIFFKHKCCKYCNKLEI
ncbi:uncharacterized protein M6B38_308670 [Iris pallida]|uniref:Uncharacterized protein n=1 Tax=Iris pallida TaxID=29817 RepID=A0AAX6HL04_IRIPA|nr:uncharacterized protein M6B38_308670 [Iris pallida]